MKTAMKAAARMRKGIGRVEDEGARALAIEEACRTILGDPHPMGMSAPLFGTLIPYARSIEEPSSLARALSSIALSIGSNSSSRGIIAVAGRGEMSRVSSAEIFAEAYEAALMILDRPEQYAARASIAVGMARVGMRDEAIAAFDEMIGEIETVAEFRVLFSEGEEDPEADQFFEGLVEVMSCIARSGMGEMEFPIVRRGIMLIEKIGDDVMKGEAVRAAAASVADSGHIDAPRTWSRLIGIAMDIDDERVRDEVVDILLGSLPAGPAARDLPSD